MIEDKLKKMLRMELHESASIDSYTWVLRVPTGWIYSFQSEHDGSMRSVFVSNKHL